MSNIDKALTVQYLDDIVTLRENISSLTVFSNIQVYLLYKQFSNDKGGSWLIVDSDTIKQFEEWLKE